MAKRQAKASKEIAPQAVAPTRRSVKEPEAVVIPALQIQRVQIKLVCYQPGDELIVHSWSEKALKEIRDKQGKKAKQGREAKNPYEDYRHSVYWLAKQPPHDRLWPVPSDVDPAKHTCFGFKTIAFKGSAVRAANDVGIPMTVTRRAFHIPGEFVKLEYDRVYMREDPVKISGGVTDLRYRGAFVDWSVVLDIELNTRVLSLEQLVNLFNTAGFGVGVGEWRPERNGVAGRFRVA